MECLTEFKNRLSPGHLDWVWDELERGLAGAGSHWEYLVNSLKLVLADRGKVQPHEVCGVLEFELLKVAICINQGNIILRILRQKHSLKSIGQVGLYDGQLLLGRHEGDVASLCHLGNRDQLWLELLGLGGHSL
jgi:hypothetical protein